MLQTAPNAQSAGALQVALHMLTPQANGKHESTAGVTQVPAPSQVERAVNVLPGVGQVGSLQLVPDAYFWQAPPAHLPLLPQVAAP
jgi:hypothetical protein